MYGFIWQSRMLTRTQAQPHVRAYIQRHQLVSLYKIIIETGLFCNRAGWISTYPEAFISRCGDLCMFL